MDSRNKQIAKNAIMLYFRMLLSMFVRLYTSRVVLQELGVEDYGIYGLVGSVIAMMGFINTSMSGATSRFITYELGRGDKQKLNEIFNSALIIHCFIALLIILLGETIGLWFLCNKLVIPEGRMNAAHWVFHLSILSAAIGITQPPYSACIMAHEKMNIYAYFELLGVSLNLLIVFVLRLFNFDKLIFYAFLVVAVSIFMRSLYRLYCIKHFEETKIKLVWNKDQLCSLLTFSGWDLYGNMSFTVVQQGRNFLINMFFGVILNAACGIATTVKGVIQGFTSNILSAFRPQIIKSYASNDLQRMKYLMVEGSKYSYLLLMIVSVPLAIEINYIIKLWLGQVPDFVPSFSRILLMQNAFITINSYFMIAIHASGNVKRFFYAGSLSLFQLPILYSLFKYFDVNPNWTYYISFFFSFLSLFIYIWIIKIQIPKLDVWNIIFNWAKPIFVSIVCMPPLFIIHFYFNPGLLRVLILFLIYCLLVSILSYSFLLDRISREKVRIIVLQKVRRLFFLVVGNNL